MDTKALRQKVLDLAIHGKLVPQDPNDEPASVLLEQIRKEKEALVKAKKIKKGKPSEPIDEVPFEVPSGWEIARLNALAFVGTGSTPNKSNKSFYGGEIAWISSGATSSSYIIEATDFITKKALDETNCQIYPVGTLVMAMYGEGKTRGQIGELAIEACTNQACAAILPYLKTTKEYLKTYLQSQYLHLRALAEGGNQPNLNINKISSYIIPLPPLAEQKRIVAEVERWMSLIDVIENCKDDLKQAVDQAKAKILDLAIKGKLVEKEDEWEEKQFKDIFIAFHSNKNKIPQREIEESGKYPVVTQSANYVEGYSNREDCIIIVEKPILLFGDHTRIVKYLDFDFVVGADGVKLFATNEFEKYAYYLLLWASHQIENRGYSRHFQYLQKIQFSIPVLSEQHRIVEKVEQLFAQLDNIANSIK